MAYSTWVTGCQECQDLLERVSVAARRHIAAEGRLQIARIRRDTDIIAALEAVVREAKAAREDALQAYKLHSGRHTASSSQAGA